MRHSLRNRAVALAAAGLAAIAGCTAPATLPQETETTQDQQYQPLTIDNCGYEITFDTPPSRVLIMQGASVGETETFILLGLQDSIYATTQYYGVSDIEGMVEQIDELPDGGLTFNDAYDVPAEQILAAQPDLVISTWSGGFNPDFGFAAREVLHDAGIKTLVNPTNCAYGKPGDVSAAEQAAYENSSTLSSLEFITLIGDIFGVPDRAQTLVDELRVQTLETVTAVADVEPARMLIAFPSMSEMNANGLPAVFSGGFYDSALAAAGGENVFPDEPGITMTLSAEQLAAADVEVLVLGAWRPDDDLEAAAQELFDAYPQWPASQTQTWVGVSDGIYLGPANAAAIAKIAQVAHPDSVT